MLLENMCIFHSITGVAVSADARGMAPAAAPIPISAKSALRSVPLPVPLPMIVIEAPIRFVNAAKAYRAPSRAHKPSGKRRFSRRP